VSTQWARKVAVGTLACTDDIGKGIQMDGTIGICRRTATGWSEDASASAASLRRSGNLLFVRNLPSPRSPGSVDRLLDMMLMHVREHLADPNLQVGELARRHHVSVSHVYKLFERIGTTPGAYLREQRLLAAQVMLSDPRYARLSTADIAAVVGLLEPRTFLRAFRRQYGMTPGSWRREHCHSGSAPAPSRRKRRRRAPGGMREAPSATDQDSLTEGRRQLPGRKTIQ
jgi:AraC-like DNA-binding protein